MNIIFFDPTFVNSSSTLIRLGEILKITYVHNLMPFQDGDFTVYNAFKKILRFGDFKMIPLMMQ